MGFLLVGCGIGRGAGSARPAVVAGASAAPGRRFES
jgi:hypothetical protein